MSIESQEIIQLHTQRSLIEAFLNEVHSRALSRQTNGDLLSMFFREAKEQHKPITFVAITCPDWIKPKGADPKVDRVIGLVDKKNKRALRFAREISSFQKALASFGISFHTFLAVSNVELPLHLSLNNMGLVIHNPETAEQNVQDSQANLAQLITDNGGSVITFDHLERVKQLLGTRDHALLQTLISGNTNPTMREFLDGLYEFDLSHTIPSFKLSGNNLVYLDIQSFSFEDDVTNFRIISNRVAPSLPIIAPFNNAGDWSGTPKGETLFSTKFEIIGRELSLKRNPSNKQELLILVSGMPDQILADFLHKRGITMVINSRETKAAAVEKALWILS